jgi:ubiquinone/menaquinone biosynthesis C-methylase UbiE
MKNLQARIVWLKEIITNMPAGLRILDAGCGNKRCEPWCSHLDYVSQDFCQAVGESTGKGFAKTGDKSRIDIVCDIVSIPEPDNSFDIILCTEVFEHLPDPIAAIREFSRLLRSGGYLILTAPFLSLTHFPPHHYYSGFNRYFYEKFLPDNGIDIVEISTNGSFFGYLLQESRRIETYAKGYAKTLLSSDEKGTIARLQKLLTSLESKDKGSAEKLCYGYHVLGKKI